MLCSIFSHGRVQYHNFALVKSCCKAHSLGEGQKSDTELLLLHPVSSMEVDDSWLPEKTEGLWPFFFFLLYLQT